MRPYAVFLHEGCLVQMPRSKAKRASILNFARHLAIDPFMVGDFQDSDNEGHELQVKIVGDYAVTFWADHAVREVKVLRLQPAGS